MNIAENIRKRRKEAGLSQMELAAMVAVEQGSISKFENGTKTPSIAMGKALADALGCTLNELIE